MTKKGTTGVAAGAVGGEMAFSALFRHLGLEPEVATVVGAAAAIIIFPILMALRDKILTELGG